MFTALITGTNRGIGLEFVKQYAQNGWQVIACCRQPSKAEKLTQLQLQFPDLIRIFPLDVTDFKQITQLATHLANESIDLLLNNAGIYPSSDKNGFGGIDYAEWEQTFKINTMAPLKMAESFVQHVKKSKLKTIATITSKMGSIADNQSGGSYLYRSSKTATNMAMKCLALDLKPLEITTVLLHPGWVQTDMGGKNALISTVESVTGMRQVISQLKLAETGKFIAFDGESIPW